MNHTEVVYVVDSDFGTKIGITLRTAKERCNEFRLAGNASARVVKQYEVHGSARLVEQCVLKHFYADRIISEWLHTHPLDVCAAVEEVLRWEVIERMAYLSLYPVAA